MLESKILELKQMLLTEAGLVEKMAALAADGLYSRQNGLLRIVNEYEDRVNQLELEIENKCIAAIALYQPEAKDLRKIVMILKINNDLERLGDQAVNIAESAEHLAGKAVVSQVSELAQMRDAAFAMLKNSLDAFAAENVEEALRGCVASVSFDGRSPGVLAPVGDFFSTAPGINPYQSLPSGVLEDGTLYAITLVRKCN